MLHVTIASYIYQDVIHTFILINLSTMYKELMNQGNINVK